MASQMKILTLKEQHATKGNDKQLPLYQLSIKSYIAKKNPENSIYEKMDQSHANFNNKGLQSYQQTRVKGKYKEEKKT